MTKSRKIVFITDLLRAFRRLDPTWALVVGMSGLAVWLIGSLPGEEVSSRPEYQLDEQSLVLPAAPPWLCRELRDDFTIALSQAGLADLIDEELAQRAAILLERHPWVKAVTFARPRYPAAIEVHLTYRWPVCFWKVASGICVLDEEGYVLPSTDLCGEALDRLFEIIAPDSVAASIGGGRARDGRLIESARLASLLGADVVEAGFRLIRAEVTIHPIDPEEITLFLVASDGRQIFWGHPPGRETPGEAAADRKKEVLLRWLEEAGQMPNQGGIVLDLTEL
ncbi:MAG: hypothetical protein NZ899_03390 [Thermoguttaceae bacterium]|nr:hypothetical protein [Thermoguttaceae bacterium]MDW8078840.1 hypothetical protein [Thermoguttaceae bacterium]